MSVSNIGIDISQFQDVAVASGDWMFVVIKLTEGTWVSNTKFAQQWAAAKGKRRGAYHYARPLKSDGHAQATYFVEQVHAAAPDFRPGFDLWQLDVEGFANDGVDGFHWASFINNFMPVALEGLGDLGFLYVGRYFFAAQLQELTQEYNWWLPDYGRNDGTLHALPAGVNPVLHQFTSVNPSLDRNVVHDVAKWNALTSGSVPAPKPGPQPTPAPAPVTIDLGGDEDVQLTSFVIDTDGAGRGWHPTVPFNKFVSATAQGPFPQVDGYWPPVTCNVQERNGSALVTVQGAKPNTKVTVFVAHTS